MKRRGKGARLQVLSRAPLNSGVLTLSDASALSRNLSRVHGPGVAEALRQIADGLNKLASALTEDGLRPVAAPPNNKAAPLPSVQDPAPDGILVGQLVSDFLRTKARANRSDRYLRALKVSLTAFAEGRRQVSADSVTVQDLERWLEKSTWSPRTQRGYLSDVRVLYSWAKKRNLVANNPAVAVELPELPDNPPAVHTPEQVKTVLEFARGYDLNICRALAVRYFAGLRSCEVDRLDESEIKEGFIEVTALKSKTRRRRLVTIQPNLRAWLALGGSLPVRDTNNRWRWFSAELAKAHAIGWPNNVTRHSFVSYHLGHFQSAGKTALQAGHTEQMTFAHYREVVTEQAAKDYWEIVPSVTAPGTRKAPANGSPASSTVGG